MNGFGVYKYSEINSLFSVFTNNENYGFGIESVENLYNAVSLYVNHKPQGSAIFRVTGNKYINFCDSCAIYMGEVKDGKKNGYGICYNSKFEILYDGLFEDDKPSEACPQMERK